ncbi:hypothetical protein FO519_000939 [Halicephalobus sp. NKZ332]|nr:hypothetical protein FO519_000939 [Halicephalobus sp. NKZ332]
MVSKFSIASILICLIGFFNEPTGALQPSQEYYVPGDTFFPEFTPVKRYRTEPIRFGKRANFREPIRFGKRSWSNMNNAFDYQNLNLTPDTQKFAMGSQRLFALVLLAMSLVQIYAKNTSPVAPQKPEDDQEYSEIEHLKPSEGLLGVYDVDLESLLEKRNSDLYPDNNSERNIRSPLGTMRFGKRDPNPLGTMRFGKRNSNPLGTMRFGKRSQVPLGTMRFGKRNSNPLGTMRFGKRSYPDYEFMLTPIGTMRFGK